MYRTNILHYYVKDFVRFSLLRRQSLRTGTASSDNSSGPSRCDAHTGGWRGSSYALNLRTEIFTQRGKRVNNSDRFADIQCGGYLSHSTISLPLPLFLSLSCLSRPLSCLVFSRRAPLLLKHCFPLSISGTFLLPPPPFLAISQRPRPWMTFSKSEIVITPH